SGHGGLRPGRNRAGARPAFVLPRQGCRAGTGPSQFGVSIARDRAARNEIGGWRRMTKERKSPRRSIRVSDFGILSSCIIALLFGGPLPLVAQEKSITFDELVQSAEQWARE